MKTTLVLAAMLAGAGGAYAQDNSPAVQAPDQTVTAPAAGQAKAATTSPDQRFRELKMMESILANAVSQGAADLAHHMQVTDPGSIIQINQARARGMELDGYGVLFDVDVPLMNLSVVMTRREAVIQSYREKISADRRVLRSATTQEDRARLQAEIDLLTAQLAGLGPRPESSAPSVAEGVQVQPVAGSVAAQTVDAAPAQTVDTRGADEMYSDAVKAALIDAMVNHGSALVLTDDEWLVVAARDNGGVPGTFDDRSGIMLRIKGSDLAAFRANKLTRDEVLKKVEISEWR